MNIGNFKANISTKNYKLYDIYVDIILKIQKKISISIYKHHLFPLTLFIDL